MTPGDVSRRSFMELVGATGVAGASDGSVNGTPTADIDSAENQDSSVPVENQLVVIYDMGTEPAAVQAAAMRVVRNQGQQAHFGKTNEGLGFLVIGLVDPVSTDERDAIKEEIASQEFVEAVSVARETSSAGAAPNYTYPINDPYYDQQNNAQHISARQAWAFTRGADQTIAVVEGKAYVEHADLQRRFADVPGIGTRTSYLCCRETTRSNSRLYNRMGPDDHATRVAGIAGARHNNEEGIAGISQATLINMASDTNYLHDDITGVRIALNMTDASIVNYSKGLSDIGDHIELWNRAVDIATERDKLIVKSAGNYGANAPSKPVKDLAKHPDVISVGATNGRTELWSGSARGDGLDVCAPGVRIMSTKSDGGYDNKVAGTSHAAAAVCGVAAMCWDTHPDLTVEQLRTRLKRTTMTLSDGTTIVDAMLAIFMPPEEPVFRENVTGLRDEGREIFNRTQHESQQGKPLYRTKFVVFETYRQLVGPVM